MKLKDGFVTYAANGEYMATATGEAGKVFNGLIRSNETADFIFRQLMQETTEEAVVDAMAQVYDAPREVLEGAVAKVVDQLRKAGFLDE